MEPPPAQSLLNRWTWWLAADAPRRLAPTTIHEYQQQVVAFARWMETMLDVTFSPESITSYRMEQYVATLEAQVSGKARKPVTVNKALLDHGIRIGFLPRCDRAVQEDDGRIRRMEVNSTTERVIR